ncbi:MAG: hypothetical protein GF331_21235 [Chitinivibrionales bacterium]|nr:hypothetical protein [Chitinivibrionales bacterium]
MVFRSRVPHQSAGLALVEYLARRFTYHAPDEWRRLVAAGRVTVNGVQVAPDTAVGPGDEVAYTPEPFEEPPADLSFEVVYEDQWFLAVNKPGDLLVHRAGRSFTHNLVYQVRAGTRTPAFPRAAASNRLDRETSGLVIVAKDSSYCGALATALRGADAHKEYLAVVHGGRQLEPGLIEVPVGRDPGSPMHYRHAVLREGGKDAVTRVVEVHPLGARHALLRLEAVTGRTHQLRLHCAHVGCPIVGDRLYGAGDGDERGTSGLIARHALHCARMRFRHPSTGSSIELVAPLPADFRALVAALRDQDG